MPQKDRISLIRNVSQYTISIKTYICNQGMTMRREEFALSSGALSILLTRCKVKGANF